MSRARFLRAAPSERRERSGSGSSFVDEQKAARDAGTPSVSPSAPDATARTEPRAAAQGPAAPLGPERFRDDDSAASDALDPVSLFRYWKYTAPMLPTRALLNESGNGLSWNAGSHRTSVDRQRFRITNPVGPGRVGFEIEAGNPEAQLGLTHQFGPIATQGVLELTPTKLKVEGFATGPTVAGLASGMKSAAETERALAYLGLYRGDNEALEGTHGIEFERSLNAYALLGASRLASSVGIGGSLFPNVTRALTYRTHLPPEEAAKVLLEIDGPIGFIRDRARGARVWREKLAVPALDEPDTMRVGDIVSLRTGGGLTVGLLAGRFGAGVGAQVRMHGEFDVSVTKRSPTVVELSVTPVKVRAVEAFAGLPLFGDAGAQVADATSVKQTFRFDLAQPSGKAAYLAALKGQLPGSLSRSTKHSLESVREAYQTETLPAGVSRKTVELSTAHTKNVGAGFNFGFFREGGRIAGLGKWWVRSEGTHQLTDGQQVARFEHHGVEQRREVLLSGTERAGVTAVKRTWGKLETDRLKTDPLKTNTEADAFQSVVISACFSDDKVRGTELNDDIIARLNRCFELNLTPITLERSSEEWKFVVDRELDATELKALAQASDGGIARAAEKADSKAGALAELRNTLRAVSLPNEQADAVLDYVAAQGLNGFAALHWLLGGEREELELSYSTDAYSEPVRQADKLLLKYPRRFELTDTVDELAKRISDARPVLQTLERALKALGDDPISTEAQLAAQRKLLEAAFVRALEVVEVDHLGQAGRKAVHRALGLGFITPAYAAAREHLERAGI